MKGKNIRVVRTVVHVKAGNDIMEGVEDAIRLAIDTRSDVLIQGGPDNQHEIKYHDLVDPVYAALHADDEDK